MQHSPCFEMKHQLIHLSGIQAFVLMYAHLSTVHLLYKIEKVQGVNLFLLVL